ncbi:hypothetical protein [Thalassotalea sp. PLHSN55]|uniref:hypothetical protein n=1 Tax=Thalassotalea sp. PLHSN55 TaxID=3435888 RepID=UPI003F835B04
MIFVASIIGVFVAVSIYFFFRAETLQREVIQAKRESKQADKESKILVDSMAILTSRYEEFAKRRLDVLFDNKSIPQEPLLIIAPLVNNYSTIVNDCLKGNGQLSKVVSSIYQSTGAKAYSDFTTFIASQDKKTQRLWSSNKFKGFVSLVEELLTTQEKQIKK